MRRPIRDSFLSTATFLGIAILMLASCSQRIAHQDNFYVVVENAQGGKALASRIASALDLSMKEATFDYGSDRGKQTTFEVYNWATLTISFQSATLDHCSPLPPDRPRFSPNEYFVNVASDSLDTKRKATKVVKSFAQKQNAKVFSDDAAFCRYKLQMTMPPAP